jgi:phospholipid/cholesterol/gamma-HCH transport system substrate-binding protein
VPDMRSLRRLPAVMALGGLALSSCGVVGGGGGGGYKLTAWFDKTISLYPASDVRVLGLPAGKVKTVKAEGGRVRVELKIDKDVPVPADVHATIVPLSLIGERYVQLFPAWTNGQPKARNDDVIPLERTEIPVEPDEALAALKQFLDSLDPDATGRLVKNAAADLKGNGQSLNDTIAGLGELVSTLADKDVQIGHIIDQFDQFTTTLSTRETQLGQVMDEFANLTGLLAQERRTLERVIGNLTSVSTNALDLVSLHAAGLDKDLTELTRLLQSVRANVGQVEQLLDAGPLLTTGLRNAYSPEYHRIDLRTQLSPTVAQALGNIGLGFTVCLPIDVGCTPSAPASAASRASRPAPAPAPTPTTAPAATAPGPTPAVAPGPSSTTTTTTPIDAILQLLGGSGPSRLGVVGPEPAVGAARAANGVTGFLRDAAEALVGVFG